ncbi:Ldh family oxidoreductase [Amaricoccus sp.]|uniref:Ldh family oxidoreductase n=1 Tax=Amaricoccus sp. TaxID=1872485 RepID=UPI0039E6F85D
MTGSRFVCEIDGSHSHGVFRVPGCRASLRSGAIDAGAEPVLDRVAPALLRVDACGGYAQPALARAVPTIRDMVAETGTATVALRDSHHFSALWPDLEPFTDAGLVALTVVSGGPTVTVRGASRNVFGTNPIAFGFPLAGARPVILDLATSTMSNGDLRIASNEGRKVPVGTSLGRDGRDTDDPAEILAHGGALPFGGHKGMALSLMVEVLASALTGGAFSHEMDFAAHPDNQTPKTGQFLLVVDPARGGNAGFAERAAGVDRLPSDRRYRHRDAAAERGIPVTDGIRALFA